MIITKAKCALVEVLTARVKENNNQEWTTIPKGKVGHTMIELTIIEGALVINKKHPMDYSIEDLVKIIKALA